MKIYMLISLMLLNPFAAQAVTEDFSTAAWLHHEELGSSINTADLVFTVPAGSSMRGVTQPSPALYPGFNPSMPASKLSITSLSGNNFNFSGIQLTDLFQMPVENILIEGYRGSTVVASDSIGPLWNDLTKQGVALTFNDFDNVERIEISSDTAGSSDIYFFIESIDYEVLSSDPTPPSTSVTNPTTKSSSSAISDVFIIALVGSIFLRRREYFYKVK